MSSAQERFSPGDVVQLKSGGVLMVVAESFDPNMPPLSEFVRNNSSWTTCGWIDSEGSFRARGFPNVVLKKVEFR